MHKQTLRFLKYKQRRNLIRSITLWLVLKKIKKKRNMPRSTVESLLSDTLTPTPKKGKKRLTKSKVRKKPDQEQQRFVLCNGTDFSQTLTLEEASISPVFR